MEAGIYYIKNAYSDLCLSGTAGRMSLQNQQSNAAHRVSQLWHISFVPGHNRYIIRPVKDFSVAMGVSSDMYVVVDDLGYEPCWDITHNSFGYSIKYYEYSNGNAKPIVADKPGSEVCVGTWETSLKCHWELEKAYGIFFRDSQTGKLLTADDVITIPLNASGNLNDVGVDVSYYGNVIGAMTWSASNASSIGVNSYTGAINAVDYGKSTIRVSATLNGTGYSAAVTLRTSIPEGACFIKNHDSGNYLAIEDQLDNTEGLRNARTHLEKLYVDSSQKWTVEHVYNGTYMIKMGRDGVDYYLAPESGSISAGTRLVLSTKPTTWKIDGDGSGAFEIELSSDASLCVGLNGVNGYVGTPVVLSRNVTESEKNMWVFAMVGSLLDVECIPQEESKWCWAACACMMTQYYFPQAFVVQQHGVWHVKYQVINETGTQLETEQAIAYYIRNIDNASLVLHHTLGEVYGPETLIQFIDDEHILYIIIDYYTDIESQERSSRHGVIICGYVLVNGEYRFVVKDPWPVNVGKTYIISYEKLYCGINAQWDEEMENNTGVWVGMSTVETAYANDTIAYYFDMEV